MYNIRRAIVKHYLIRTRSPAKRMLCAAAAAATDALVATLVPPPRAREHERARIDQVMCGASGFAARACVCVCILGVCPLNGVYCVMHRNDRDLSVPRDRVIRNADAVVGTARRRRAHESVCVCVCVQEAAANEQFKNA